MPLLIFGPIAAVFIVAVLADPHRNCLVTPLLVIAAAAAVMLPIARYLDYRDSGVQDRQKHGSRV